MGHLLDRAARRIAAGYRAETRPGDASQPPAEGHLATLVAYCGVVAAVAGVARWTGRAVPARLSVTDLVSFAAATHKISRLIAKDSVTSPLRAPFTRYQGPTGEAELNEQVRGEGVRHTVGELLTCPFCLAVWVATGLSTGLVFAPRVTRLVAATFTAVAVSDFLQLGYDMAKRAASGD